MVLYQIRQRMTFFWNIEADGDKEAIEMSHDVGDSQADSIKYGKRYATKIKGSVP